MEIIDMKTLPQEMLQQAGQILTDELPEGWANLGEAMEEINDRLFNEKDNTFLAVVEDNTLIGFVGILPIYGGKVFELHPLAVRKDMQGRGIGRLLVESIEKAARERNGITMWLGADDEREPGQTSFANVNLYEDLSRKIEEFNPGRHQTAFYIKMGYTVVGVMPDANGIGKPDIFLAKRL